MVKIGGGNGVFWWFWVSLAEKNEKEGERGRIE
jgi:hypothetical protein